MIPRGKLLRQVSSGIYLTDSELWQQYRDRNEQVEIRFVPMDPATRYEDEAFDVPRDEIEAYYEANTEEFAIPARATVKVAVLPKVPLPSDTAASVERAREIRQEVVEGEEDFGELARLESADEGTAESGGELGVFTKGQMVAPFDSAVFNSRPGTITQPVRTAFGLHIIEVQDRWGQDSAQARHILVPFSRTDSSEIALLTQADSLEDMGETMPLEEAAANLGLEAPQVQITEDFPFVAGAGQIPEGIDWALNEAEAGMVSPVFENSQAFYALELVSAEPAGTLPLEDAAPAIESTLRFELKMEQAREDAQDVVSQVRGGESLPNVAADLGLEVRPAGPFSRTDFVPGMGRQNAAIGAAFGLDVGEVSDAVSTPANVFVIEKLDHIPADSTTWLEQKNQQRGSQIQVLQQQRLQEWIAALREAADIVDRRDEVLQPADEQDVPQMPMAF